MPNPIVDPLVEVPDTSPTSELVRIDATVAGAVTVTMDRPAQKNALDADLISALSEAFEDLRGAEGVRVVFLKGAGGTFTTGVDAEWIRQAGERAEADNRADALAAAVMLKRLWDLPALTVAMVEGAALGGGTGLVAACDLAVAVSAARFGFSEVRRGLIPAVVSPYVVGAVGARAARGLFASGREFDAAQAHRLGLVTEVVADAAALRAAHDRIAREAVACAPDAVAQAKALVGRVAGRPIDRELMEETARAFAKVRASEEGQEGVRAFLERRNPNWA
jgi:methylglutaconyl-CoA hydratase